MKKLFVIAAMLLCVSFCESQTMSRDTLVLTSSTRGITKPVSTGHYVKLSAKREGELVYHGLKKNEKTGHYSYFVVRPDKDNNPRRVYLTRAQVEAFIRQFGE